MSISQTSKFSIYPDQNVLSSLQRGAEFREDMVHIVDLLTQAGGVFVFADIHVAECRASNRPDEFVEILEHLNALYLESTNTHDDRPVLKAGCARNLILAPTDFAEAILTRMQDMLRVIHFAMGWLGETDAEELRSKMIDDLRSDWSISDQDLPKWFHLSMAAKLEEAVDVIRSIPIVELSDETAQKMEEFRQKLPKSYAQLDEIPADEAVEKLLSLLGGSDAMELKKQFPRNFLKNEPQPVGTLTGFAFMLFAMGLVRDRRTKSGDMRKRHKHFLGQFRDCQHIENAAQFSLFITLDKGAARLAKAVFSYAGATTEVASIIRAKP